MGEYITVNLEAGMPTAGQAMRRLGVELSAARSRRVRAIKVIHGFGSSGTGGKIRTELRRKLPELAARGQIKYYVPGETFSIFDAGTRRALADCPALRGDSDLERYNNGITIVIL